jgi:hypothetical protein
VLAEDDSDGVQQTDTPVAAVRRLPGSVHLYGVQSAQVRPKIYGYFQTIYETPMQINYIEYKLENGFVAAPGPANDSWNPSPEQTAAIPIGSSS